MEKEFSCLRCGEKMELLRREYLQLGKTGWILGDLSNLVAGALAVEIYKCSGCGKLEFFSTEEENGDESKIANVACPHCGRRHEMDDPRCPFCGADNPYIK